MATHHIEASDKVLHGSFSPEHKPVLTIENGDSVTLNTIGLEWGLKNKDGSSISFRSRTKEKKSGHPLIGPVYINGAKPGMMLAVRMNKIVPGWYGWNVGGGSESWQNEHAGISFEEKTTLNWELNAENMTGKTIIGTREFQIPLSPFMGVLATAPAEKGLHSTIPPRYCGGNIDCKELVEGSTVYLPVAVEGALFSTGDGHAVQGDGEVSGTAIECPMDEVSMTFTLFENQTIRMPRADTPSGWLTFGFDEDLNKAAGIALKEMIDLMQERFQVSREEAIALGSTVVDLRITQVVNKVKGVHAVLPHGLLEVKSVDNAVR
ncbi:acetamidase/formamidase family protein [Jeotgalibacillus salarius]|uniref:Acetamidase n=1 Tax=Jeotgalibacillus salarius TaxID=546023 RepID=A0A4Y8LID2_9BACL|nr:acetamidase/formamidase family protein [Jeotgalibacillus salarius]TFE02131.1 acetamidase [Jeotgalibacillus salarius]